MRAALTTVTVATAVTAQVIGNVFGLGCVVVGDDDGAGDGDGDEVGWGVGDGVGDDCCIRGMLMNIEVAGWLGEGALVLTFM